MKFIDDKLDKPRTLNKVSCSSDESLKWIKCNVIATLDLIIFCACYIANFMNEMKSRPIKFTFLFYQEPISLFHKSISSKEVERQVFLSLY